MLTWARGNQDERYDGIFTIPSSYRVYLSRSLASDDLSAFNSFNSPSQYLFLHRKLNKFNPDRIYQPKVKAIVFRI